MYVMKRYMCKDALRSACSEELKQLKVDYSRRL